MAEFPALPLWTDALLADAGHLKEDELGAYLKILILIWRNAGCRIPADADWHMRKLSVTQARYEQLYLPIMEEFCRTDGNYITQKRLTKEFEYLRTTTAKNTANAKARWNKKKDPCDRIAPTPTPTPPKEDAATLDFKKVIFDTGLRWLATQAKRTPTGLRSILGKWVRDYGEANVAGAIIAAQKASAVDPVPYIEKILREAKNGNTGNAGARGGAENKSDRAKRILVAGVLAERGADEGREGEGAPSDPAPRLL